MSRSAAAIWFATLTSVACHNKAYVANYDMVSDLKEGGSFLLACDWADVAALDAHLPVSMRRAIAKKHINLYVIDSVAIAAELGLGNRTNTILQAAFFHITGIIPDDKAVEYMKAAALKSYGKKGEKVVNMNYAAVDRGICGAVKIDYPASWADLADETPAPRKNVPEFVTKIMEPVNNMHGDELPSALSSASRTAPGRRQPLNMRSAASPSRSPHGMPPSACSATSALTSAPTPPSVPSC